MMHLLTVATCSLVLKALLVPVTISAFLDRRLLTKLPIELRRGVVLFSEAFMVAMGATLTNGLDSHRYVHVDFDLCVA